MVRDGCVNLGSSQQPACSGPGTLMCVCVDAQPATQSSFHRSSAIIYLGPVTVETSPAAQPRGGTDPGGKRAWKEPADGGTEASSLSEQRKRDLCTRNQHQFWILLTSWSLVPSNQPVVWASARFVAVVQKFPETKIIFPDSSRSQRMGGGRRGQTQDPGPSRSPGLSSRADVCVNNPNI